MIHKVAVSLAPRDTEACLQALAECGSLASMAELRLDLMESFDLPRLQALSPCPLIITCRPQREGGRFAGSEQDRLAILQQAIQLECAYIDVEWDCIELFADRAEMKTQVIVSRHWFDQMPPTLDEVYAELAPRADVVKLVGLAQQPTDLLPTLSLLRNATGPVIALAMGEVGRLIRLIGPCFPQCLLTYGAASQADITAPGQLSVAEMVQRYHLDKAGPHTQIHLHLCAGDESAQAVAKKNDEAEPGADLYLPLRVPSEQISQVVAGFRTLVPRVQITADPMLATALLH
ncbi:MAG: type I 3-dehydroquinate dehydratase [Chloroflexi bacterium]|nr:type I 3-dehydroquinate dehydratase [Chloroflexota bacterium]